VARGKLGKVVVIVEVMMAGCTLEVVLEPAGAVELVAGLDVACIGSNPIMGASFPSIP
jgi:hypothetical protein